MALRQPWQRWGGVIAVLAGLLVVAPPAEAGHSSLLGHWPLDTATSTAGGTTPDASGHGFTGTDVRGSLVPGRFGNALSLGAAGDGVDVADDPLLRPFQVTFTAWVRHSGDPGADRVIVAKGFGPDCSSRVVSLDTSSSAGGLRFRVRIYSQEPVNVTDLVAEVPSASIWDGRWHAVAGTFGNSEHPGVRLWIDRTLVASAPHPSGDGYNWRGPFYQSGSNRGQAIGRHTHPDCPAGTNRFPGAIDDVRFYARPLDSAEIATVQPAEGEPEPVPEPPPPPPPPEPPPSGGAGGSAPPEVTELRPQRAPFGSGATLVTANVVGDYQRLEWFVGNRPQPVIISRRGQTTFRLGRVRVPTTVGVRAIGLGGASPRLNVDLAATPPVGGAIGGRIISATERRPPVFGAGGLFEMSSRPLKVNCSVARNPVRVAAEDGLLDIEGGCVAPITTLGDIPAEERGIVIKMAHQYGIPLTEGAVNLGLRLSDAYLSRGKVRINGVDFDPGDGAAVVIFPQARLIASSNARMSVGDLVLDNARRFEMDTRAQAGRILFGSFEAIGGLDLMKGFRVFGDVQVEAVRGDFAGSPAGATITASLRLPSFLRFGGSDAHAVARMRASTDRGLILDALHVGPLDLSIGPVGIQRFQIDYDGPRELWTGQGVACLPTGHPCLRMAFPEGGVRILRGNLEFAGATLPFTPPVTLFPGIDMDSIGFAFGLSPTRFLASTKLVAARLLAIDGRMVVAFPTAAEPYALERDVGWLEPDSTVRRFPPHVYGQPRTTFTVGASAAGSLRLPAVGDIPLGAAYLLYEYPGYFIFGGAISKTFLGVAHFEGGVRGEMNAANGRFDFHGDMRACLALCYGGDVHVSSVGASACVRPPVVPDFGIGVRWPGRIPQDWSLQGPGCRWSPYRQLDVRGGGARAAQAGSPIVVSVRRGDPGRSIRLVGADGAPRVRVTAPDGTVLETPEGEEPVAREQLMVVRFDRLKSTLVGIGEPDPGDYRIEVLDGSPPVTEAASATEQPPARVAASVTGSGTRRVLRYDIRRREAQRTTFLEVMPSGAARTIGTVSGGGRGRLSFSPAPGVGARTIVAQFELAGLPAERVQAARFAPPSPRLGRPRRLRVRRVGTRLRVRWARVRGAARYEIAATTTGAGQRRIRTRRTAVTIGRIPRSSSGRVSVRPVATLRQGKRATARFRATTRRVTRLRRLPRAPRL